MPLLVFIAGACALMPLPALAHAFGTSYALPLPATLYILGGSLAVLFSFVVLALSPRVARGEERAHERMLLSHRRIAPLISLLRAAAVGFLGVCIVAGLVGDQSPVRNIAPLAFWVLLLLAFAYASVFVRGLWDAINPFASGLPFIKHRTDVQAFPRRLAFAPVVALYALLIAAELLFGGAGAVPRIVALALLSYWVGSWIVIDIYGREAWRTHVDVFGAFFSVMGSFAPFSLDERGFSVRHPFARSAPPAPASAAVVFIVTVLALTAFDGFKETAPYAALMIPLSHVVPFAYLELAAFLLFPVAFLGVYALCIGGVRLAARGVPFAELMRAYALSLAPIAVVYHFAHYLPLLAAEGQRIVALASDPLGYGWNLFGGAAFSPNPALVGAEAMWYLQLSAIVLGHIAALSVSHLITRRLVPDRRRAFLAEVPMVAVMVAYTAFGLWILAQPFAL